MNTSHRSTSNEAPRVAVSAQGSHVRRKAARKQWKPNTKVRTFSFFLDENGNAYQYTDKEGRAI
jgi:hypothetical protein